MYVAWGAVGVPIVRCVLILLLQCRPPCVCMQSAARSAEGVSWAVRIPESAFGPYAALCVWGHCMQLEAVHCGGGRTPLTRLLCSTCGAWPPSGLWCTPLAAAASTLSQGIYPCPPADAVWVCLLGRYWITTPLEAGMIVSNEPGYYEDGAFGIRIENLLVRNTLRH